MAEEQEPEAVPVLPPSAYPLKKGERLKPSYTLTEEEQRLLKEFRQLIEQEMKKRELNVKQRRYVEDDGCLVRYLRARDWDLEKSKTLLMGTIDNHLNLFGLDILIEDYGEALSKEGCTGKTYRNGKDKQGRPILYLRDRNQNTKDYENQVRFTIYNLEMAVASMDLSQGVEKWVLIIDFKGQSISNAPPLKVSKQILDIMMDHFPERLGDAFMVDPPFMFWIFWKAISPFIPTGTKNKIHFVSGSLEEKRKIFEKYIDLDVLEEDFGGYNKCSYQHELYWKKDMESWPIALRRFSEEYEGEGEEDEEHKKKKNKHKSKDKEDKEAESESQSQEEAADMSKKEDDKGGESNGSTKKTKKNKKKKKQEKKNEDEEE